MLSPIIICPQHSHECVCVCECVENTCLAPTAAEWVRERASASELAGATYVGAFACLCVCVCKHQCRQRRSWFFCAHSSHTYSAKNIKICLSVCVMRLLQRVRPHLKFRYACKLVHAGVYVCTCMYVCFANFSEKFAIQKLSAMKKC